MKLLIIILLTIPTILSAQERSFSENLGQDLANVGISALTGTIIGLSTLVFTEEPLDHYRNITIGASIGILIGVGIVYYNRTKNDYFVVAPGLNGLAASYTLSF